METVTCPECGGGGSAPGIVCGSDGCRAMNLQCGLCGGSGTVTVRQANWYRRGNAMREARKAAGRTLRQEADRRGMTQVRLSKMEAGRIEPDEKA